MSKHLRGQRRYTGPREPQMNVDETLRDPAQVAPEESSAPGSVDVNAGAGSFSARDLSQPELSENGSFVGETEPQTPLYPNGDDPDRVPVTPELADDEVPNMPGAILKHAREMLGMSQREVAEKLQLRVNSISDLEHDRLNQPTAEPFVSKHLKHYAELVNIDPQAVLELYRQNVREAKTQAFAHQSRMQRQERRSSLLKLGLLGAGAVVLVGAGVVIGMSLSSSDPEESSGALVLEPAAQVQQQMAEENGALDAPLPPETVPEEPVRLDPNTEMAREQARALGTNEIISNAQKPADDSVKLSEEKPTLSVAPAAASQALIPESKPQAASAPIPVPAVQNAPVERTLTAVPKVQNAEARVESRAEALQSKSAAATANKPSETKSAEGKAPQLGAVRDITSSAKLTNRTDIGSLNSVSVSVLGPVSLRIKGNGKLLKSGTFKKGDTVSATGMPPLRVEVTDSSLIRVSYNGGRVSVPAGRNVGYDLPTR